MASDYTIRLGPTPLVCIRPTGVTNREEWLSTLTALTADEMFRPGMPVLIDMRQMGCVPPPGRGPHIARDVETWLAGSAVAFVATDVTLFGVARQIAIIIGNRADVFTSTADATQWLCAADVGRDIPFQR